MLPLKNVTALGEWHLDHHPAQKNQRVRITALEVPKRRHEMALLHQERYALNFGPLLEIYYLETLITIGLQNPYHTKKQEKYD